MLLSITLFAGCVSSTKSSRPVDVGPPIAAPVALDDAMVTLAVSDLHGFLDETGTLLSGIVPMLGGPMLKTMLGSRLGDPQLAGIAPSNGLAIVMLDPTNVFAVVEVAADQAPLYLESLASMGVAAEQQDGLLLIAKTEDQLAVAEPLALTVQSQMLASRRSPALRIAAKPAMLVAKHEEQISFQLEKIFEAIEKAPTVGDAAKTEEILKAELMVLLSLCRQVDAVETGILPEAGALRITKTIQPTAESRLAAYCNAPALNGFNPLIQSASMPEGAVEMEFCIRNLDALLALFEGEMTDLFGKMDFDPALLQSWIAYAEQWMDAIGPTAKQSIFTSGGTLFSFTGLKEVENESAMLDALRTMESDLQAMGFFRLYRKLGMPLSVAFEENVRKYAGVNIHRLNMEYSFNEMSGQDADMLQSMFGDMHFDMAMCRGVLVYTAGEGQVEKMIDQLKSPGEQSMQLAARSVFPSGGTSYADFDVAGYFNFISSFMNEMSAETAGSLKKLSAFLEGAEPVAMAGYCNSGRLKFCSRIPADLLIRCAQAGQAISMEMMQKNAAMTAGQEPSPPVGPAPDGTLNLLDGSSVQISSYAGQKVVVLDFWASWCGPCRKGLPMVQLVANHFTGSDVVFYAVNLNEDEEAVREFLKEAELTLPIALDDGTLSDAFGVSGIPYTVIIGKDGTILSTHTGLVTDLDAQLTAEINSALAE